MFQMENNPYVNCIGDVDCMLKFPSDRARRPTTSKFSDIINTMIDTFKDAYKIILLNTDPIETYMWEMYEIKQFGKKERGYIIITLIV